MQDGSKILGHGGLGIKSGYPMDSYPSLDSAYNFLDGTEGDVQMTKDGILVYWHDKELPKVEGMVSDYDFDSLPDKSYLFKTYQIVTVDSFLASRKENKPVSLDLKTYGLDNNQKKIFAKKLKELAGKYSSRFPIFMETRDMEMLNFLLNDKSGYLLFYYAGSGKESFDMCKSHKIDGISIHYKHISASEVQHLHEIGCKVMIWGITTGKDLKKALKMGADYYQTNKIRFRRQKSSR